MNLDLFDLSNNGETWTESITDDAVVLRQFLANRSDELLVAIQGIEKQSPFRHMQTAGGFTMSAAITGCGDYGWISDRRGYRYSKTDPLTNKPWPTMPDILKETAQQCADKAGYANFNPDACLINRYEPKSKMSLHQDKDEQDFTAPIVSISLGVPATFLFGGPNRSDKTIKVPVTHGDVVVWGGTSRLFFHGVSPIKQNYHPFWGEHRINITFRVAG
jgi:alkylated DNA repair protein (DNA oxidative demethylase)